MKSTLKRIVSLLFLLLLSAVMMTGCISADIAVVGGEVTAAPSSGKLRLLLEQPSAMPIDALPAKNLTLEEVNLTDDSEFVLVDLSTGKRASTVKNAYIEKDPQYTNITWKSENGFECQISILIPLRSSGRYLSGTNLQRGGKVSDRSGNFYGERAQY